jgi:hypothetical protein
LRRQLTTEAIALAMEGRWEEAVTANREIIAVYPTDVDACNRLGRALMELGQYDEAKESYRRTLELESSNSIAKRNLERLSHLKEAPASKEHHKVAPHLFVEEIGRAGVVKLIQLAPKEILARMVAGAAVNLRTNGQTLLVESQSGEYLGQVELKHAYRLLRLMAGGNKYEAAITNLDEGGVKVIIREIFQHPSQVGRLSFPVKDAGSFRPYVKGSMLRHELEETPEDGEEEELTLEESGYSLEWEGEVVAEEPPIDVEAMGEGPEQLEES